MKAWLREPLVHFLALGAVWFLLSARPAGTPAQLHVTAGQVENLRAAFARTWQRPPSAAELEGLVEGYIQEEVMVREALALGLDRDDPVVRRRLAQKLEFLAEDVAPVRKPSVAELQAFLDAHPEAYRQDQRITFSHVYFNPGEGGADAARRTLLALQANPRMDPGPLGDRFLLDRDFQAVTREDVARMFGPSFAEHLASMETGAWLGPIRSGLGLHLVRVQERLAGRPASVAGARAALERDWTVAERAAQSARRSASLRAKYTVVREDAR